MNLDVGLKMSNVSFETAQTKMDLIKIKIDELQINALNYIKFNKVGIEGAGEINFVILLKDLTLSQSITKLTAIKNKISDIENLEIVNYKLI